LGGQTAPNAVPGILTYDDSDGWYDHAYSGVTNPSLSVADDLTGSGQCGPRPQTVAPLGSEQGRCGFGPRMPLMLISPCAAPDHVDHNLSDQSSILNFIEYNWGLPSIPGSFDQALGSTDKAEGIPFDLAGLFDFSKCNQPPLILDPDTGQIDLRNANVRGANLQHGDLSSAEANNADFKGDKMNGAFLKGIDLAGASLQGVNLRGADLSNADATDARFRCTNLERADAENANLTGAALQGANLHDVLWSNTTCPDGTNSNADGGTCAGHLG
jgi:hypothetical protein